MLISNAYAQAATGASGDPMANLAGFLPIILIFGVMWFMMIRPQMKKAKEQKAMVDALAKGDEILTQSGIAGRITKIGENYLTLEVGSVKDAPVEIFVQKHAIGALLPKGTLKSL